MTRELPPPTQTGARDRVLATMLVGCAVLVGLCLVAGIGTWGQQTSERQASGTRRIESGPTGFEPSRRPEPQAPRQQPGSTLPKQPETAAAQMAMIDRLEVIPDGDRRARPYSRLLIRLERKCTNSQRQIADITCVTQELLAKKGIHKSLLEIMHALDRTIPDEFGDGVLDLKEVAALLVVAVR